MVFPWVEASLEAVRSASDADTSRKATLPTANAFLQMMCELKIILLQDAAATLVLHPERANHALFKQMAVFSHPTFMVSQLGVTTLSILCLTIDFVGL